MTRVNQMSLNHRLIIDFVGVGLKIHIESIFNVITREREVRVKGNLIKKLYKKIIIQHEKICTAIFQSSHFVYSKFSPLFLNSSWKIYFTLRESASSQCIQNDMFANVSLWKEYYADQLDVTKSEFISFFEGITRTWL